ncbi:hypothetical protein H5410_049775 [Solanum commersonii]|uniref:Uncharacterized protein n=1 Tax=Solanum commersonii TaxID=4109 RepID=A0A9J5WVM8_SOLCO|nr:hypothetical protein H5410_049775 [Solanum commersonii]
MYFSRKLTGMQIPRKSDGKNNIYIKIQCLLRLLQVNQAIKNVRAHDIVLIDETRENGEIDVDVTRCIGAGRQNGCSNSEYCDKNVLARLKGKFYRVVVPILLYGTQYWPTKNVHDEYSGDEDTQMNV